MKYLALLAYPEGMWAQAGPEQQAAWHENHLRFYATVGSNLLAGEALSGADTATTLRHDEGRPVLTDGPFAETAEVIGGFYLLQAPDLDTVTRWCELLPDEYAVEIRPCVRIEGFD